MDLNAFDDLIESCGALYDVAEAMAADVAPLVVNMDCTDLSSFADSCVFLDTPMEISQMVMVIFYLKNKTP